jgi:hypothetical protein
MTTPSRVLRTRNVSDTIHQLTQLQPNPPTDLTFGRKDLENDELADFATFLSTHREVAKTITSLSIFSRSAGGKGASALFKAGIQDIKALNVDDIALFAWAIEDLFTALEENKTTTDLSMIGHKITNNMPGLSKLLPKSSLTKLNLSRW